MSWLLFVSGVLGGGIVAALLAEVFRMRRAYRTALLMVLLEVVKNLTWIEQAKSDAGAPHRARMFQRGWFITDDWDRHSAALAYRMEAKNVRLWVDLAAEYMSLRAISLAGEEPPDAAIASLAELQDRLRTFDPPFRVRVLRFAMRRRLTQPVGKLLARLVWDLEQAEAASVLVARESAVRAFGSSSQR